MFRWRFETDGGSTMYLIGLTKGMRSRHLAILHDNPMDETGHAPFFFFTSHHLDEINDVTTIYQNASQLKWLFDGANYLLHEDKREYLPFKLSRLKDDNDNYVLYEKTAIPYVFNVQMTLKENPLDFELNVIAEIISLAAKDELFRGILIAASDGMNMPDMYIIRDSIFFKVKDEIKRIKLELKSNAKDQTLVTRKNILQEYFIDLKQKLKGFDWTVNNSIVSGKQSRHGLTGEQPPPNPLTLEDAWEVFNEVFVEFLSKIYNLNIGLIPRTIRFTSNDLFATDF